MSKDKLLTVSKTSELILSKDAIHETSLFYAVQERNNESVVRALVDGGADVNRTDNEGKTALFYAVQVRNNETVVRALVDGGADVNITDNEGKTALFYAVQVRNNETVVRALVNRDADVNRTDNEEKTALFYAVRQWDNENVVRILVGCGADVNTTDNEGKTALFYAVQQCRNESLVRALVGCRAHVNISDIEGKTALFYAVQESRNESVVRALVGCRADVNRTDNEGKTALFYTVHQSVIHLLIDAGAHLNARDHCGRTPLFYAITESDILSCLLDRGANLYLEDNYSVLAFLFERLYETPFEMQDSMHILLNKKTVSKEHILKAILSVVFIKFLSFNPKSYDFDRDPLQELLRVAKHYTTLVDGGQRKATEKISKRVKDKRIRALFQQETMRIILRELVELGANPNSVDSDGNSALHHVIQLSWRGVSEQNVLYICHQLKEMGASVHIKNHNNETPLVHCLVTTIKEMSRPCQWSDVKTQLAVCQFLIEHGSDVEEKTQSGKYVLHMMLELIREWLLHKELRSRNLDDLIRLLSEVVRRAYKQKEVSKDNDGNTPLHLWAKLALPPGEDYSIIIAEGHNFQGVLSIILNRYKQSQIYDVNDKNNNGETPLHVCRTWTAVELLLYAGAKPEDVDSLGRSPLVVAAENHKSFSIPGHFYPDVLQEPKAFWKTAVLEKGLDPWTVDNQGESVMSILLEEESFHLAKGMIEFACEDNTPGCAQHLFSLLCAVCKDKSTSALRKADLVRIILESEKCPLPGRAGEDSPLHFCCRNIVKNPNDDNVHWAIAKKLLFYEANPRILNSSGESCLDIAEGCEKLKESLLMAFDINIVPLNIRKWRSISTVHNVKLSYVARGRRSIHVKPYWYHREDLARGSFGAVFAGINEKDGREVAMKRIEKIRMMLPQDKREISNLTSLADCEQVVRYLHFFEDDNFSYTVLELMEGHLDQFLISAIQMDTKVSLCLDVVKGLKHLHDHSILHRDLKPSNILYKTHPKLCLKIADFGLSRRIDSTDHSTSVYGTNAGTRCWIAPEVLTSTKFQHSTASDMFSCGLVLHYILSAKKHPFAPAVCANKNAIQIIHETESNVMNGNMEGWDDSLCPEAAHLLKAMLDEDKKKRPSASAALVHPFFWTKEKKLDLLIAVGNQPEIECPRAKRTHPLTAVETDLETRFNTIVKYADWNDPGYAHMPAIYAEMTRRRGYVTHSVVELVRFIRNAVAHVSDKTRSTPIRKQILEDFVFLEYFPDLVMEVYKAVTTHGWDQTREEIKFRHQEIRVCKKR